MKLKTAFALATLALATGLATAQTQGVSKNEIVIGSIQDLSGPLAALGKQVRYGMQLRVDELNEQSGGIHGRKIKLLIEDSQYDPKKAVLAAQKLVNQDKIFAMIGHIGTTNNLAAMPIQFAKNVPNLNPITASKEMYEPFHKLKVRVGALQTPAKELEILLLLYRGAQEPDAGVLPKAPASKPTVCGKDCQVQGKTVRWGG